MTQEHALNMYQGMRMSYFNLSSNRGSQDGMQSIYTHVSCLVILVVAAALYMACLKVPSLQA